MTFLPAPVNQLDDADRAHQASQIVPVAEVSSCPPYGQRKGWMPKRPEDYGDGGAFPEIDKPQFPIGMGTSKKGSTSTAIAKQVDSEGKIRYDVLARVGQRPDKIIYSKATDLQPKTVDINDASLIRPDADCLKEDMDKTHEALQRIVAEKQNAALPVRRAEKQGDAEYLRYTPAQQGSAFNSGAAQSIIKIHDAQVDPLEPPKFRLSKKIPRASTSPPAPVLHSPTKKLSVKEQQEWKVPPSISNFKNQRGYTIPLDKRLAADGRGLQQVRANERFAILSESLHATEKALKETSNIRHQVEQKILLKEKEQKEEKLKILANEAREQRSAIYKTFDKEAEDRDEMRKDLARERQMNRNIARAAPDKRKRLERERQRDVSEKIALGMPNPGNHAETMYDQRLFNQSKGLDSGYAGGDDERYDVYDEPWGAGRNIANSIYKAPRNVNGGVGTRDPVQFEKEEKEDDPFGLNKFLDEAKKGQKRKDRDDRSKHESSKRMRRN